MPEEKKTVRKKIAAATDLNNFMRDYYLELDAAAQKGSPKIAWCTSVGPAEILRAFGFQVYFPETHSAMLGATRMATDFIPVGERHGIFPRHLLLSYSRHRRLPEGGHPPREGVQHQEHPQTGCPGVQHQSVPGRAGLVQLVRRKVQRTGAGCPHLPRGEPGHRQAHLLHRQTARGADPAAGEDCREEVRAGRPETDGRPLPGVFGALEEDPGHGRRHARPHHLFRRHDPHGAGRGGPRNPESHRCLQDPPGRTGGSASKRAKARSKTRNSASTGTACRSGAG